MKSLISIIVSTLFLTISLSVFAEEKISTVQRAAAERLVGKLGELRGSVKPEDKSIFVTMEMVSPIPNSDGKSDGIGNSSKTRAPVKPKLPPIVLEMSRDIDDLLSKILSGKVKQKVETKIPEDKPFNLHDALTIAQADYNTLGAENKLALKNQAFEYLEEYLTPPAQTRETAELN